MILVRISGCKDVQCVQLGIDVEPAGSFMKKGKKVSSFDIANEKRLKREAKKIRVVLIVNKYFSNLSGQVNNEAKLIKKPENQHQCAHVFIQLS
ncbi:CLUMA_CG008180, isoform A [Clunio marinus]|uniref:CLUMA_CG008180, isoform A n=1 Tax=Clunio marinus TaxID=568069 RepID=A0A1J1I2Z1_9DIPT|nr:CLUMA_CG008180, isoform A [Clunio marinus]